MKKFNFKGVSVQYVTYALTVIGSIWAWWKNNSFTDKAQNADKLLNGGDDNGN